MITTQRTTKETDIALSLEVYGEGKADIATGVGFFDHMLEALSKHGLMDISLTCKGDTHIDFHHSVEDVGIVLGQALKEALFPVGPIERYGNAVVVMDEAAVSCALDVSNRPYLVYDVDVAEKIGDFDAELAEEFFRALVTNAGLSVHLVKERGKNKHHIIEATFKAFAVALRRALAPNPRAGVPSTKGVL